MKLRLVALAACLLALAALDSTAQAAGGLSPDKGEIESASSAKIVFVSYEGPSTRIDSATNIAGIGSSLGNELRGSGGPARAGDARYRVIRAVDLTVKEGLDADIIVLGQDAQVDHIRNLRRIIAGYLSAAWGYSEKDAATLAVFVTVYNAVHRGEMKYFDAKYKAVVRKELSPESAGLALNYTEWPGKSRIVIPLSAGAKVGALGAIDTGAVSDKKVAESLKAQPDKGVPDRQALVDVKEREAAQKQADADKQKADLAAAEKKLADDKAKAEADRAALEAAKGAALEAAKAKAAAPAAAPLAAAPAAAPSAPAAAAPTDKGGEAAPAELATKEAAVKAEEASVKAQEADVAAKKDEAAKTEAGAVAKKEEAAADRKDITADQKAAIAAQVADKGKAEAAGVFLVRVGDDANHLAQIVFVDAGTGKGIRSSRINSLHYRSLAELADSFVAVSGIEGKAGGVKLVKLDKASLESVAEAKPDMFAESSVLVSGDALYAIVAAGGKQYLALFAAADLAEKARSQEAVAPFTFIREAAGGIVVQAPSGGDFLVLKKDSLEKAKDLKP
jgi:Borrelia P83/100 protein